MCNISTEHLVKFGSVIFGICERRDKQTDRHADSNPRPYGFQFLCVYFSNVLLLSILQFCVCVRFYSVFVFLLWWCLIWRNN